MAAGAATLGGVPLANAAAESEDDANARYWQKKQKEYEAIEKELKKAYKAFGPPPKYIYRRTDLADDKATFYAPLKEECTYLPEFQSIFQAEDPKEIREEFTWLQYRHLCEVFKHPLEESFQIKRVPSYNEPMWVPRLDQKAKWAPFMEHPEQLIE